MGNQKQQAGTNCRHPKPDVEGYRSYSKEYREESSKTKGIREMDLTSLRPKKYYARTRILNIKISKAEEDFLRNEAFRLKKSMSELVRQGILEGVEL